MRAIDRHRGPSAPDFHRLSASGEIDEENPHRHKRPGHRKRDWKPAPNERPDRKACQLCRQVAETLDEVLADCGDGVLRGLRVASVTPFPNGSRLLVTLAPIDGRLAPQSSEVVMEHLNTASGHLRYQTAAALTRRRVPLLLYRLADPAIASVES